MVTGGMLSPPNVATVPVFDMPAAFTFYRGVLGFEVVNTSKENLVAIVDPDEKAHAKIKRWLQQKQQDPDKLQVFTDYRVMYDKIGKQIDALAEAFLHR